MNHEDVICNTCKTLHHQKCKTSSIQEKTSKVLNGFSRNKTSYRKYNCLKQESSGSKKEIETLKEYFKNEIERFRNILTDLDKCKQNIDHCVDQDIATIAAADKLLKVDCKYLEDAIRGDDTEAMFVADFYISKAVQSYRPRKRYLHFRI